MADKVRELDGSNDTERLQNLFEEDSSEDGTDDERVREICREVIEEERYR